MHALSQQRITYSIDGFVEQVQFSFQRAGLVLVRVWFRFEGAEKIRQVRLSLPFGL